MRKSALVTRGWGLVPLHTCTSLECEQWPLKGFSKANLGDAFGCDAASRNKSKARLMTNTETVKFHQTSRSQKQKQKKSNGDVIPTGFVNISSFLSDPGFRPGRRLLKGKVRNLWKRHVFSLIERPLEWMYQCWFQRSSKQMGGGLKKTTAQRQKC